MHATRWRHAVAQGSSAAGPKPMLAATVSAIAMPSWMQMIPCVAPCMRANVVEDEPQLFGQARECWRASRDSSCSSCRSVEFAARDRAVVVADQDHHDRRRARRRSSATCSAEFGTISDSRRLSWQRRIDETDRRRPALPGQRPAMVVASTMAGMKKMNGDARLRDAEKSPSAAAPPPPPDGRKSESAQRRFFDPWPQPREAESPG